MLTLHYAPDNASAIIRLVMEEAGIPFATALVDRRNRAQDSAAYRSINPAGHVPALETPDGPIFETAAILLWLADRHPGLAPAPDAPDRGRFLSWLFFLSNTPQADLRRMFYPWLYAPPEVAYEQRAIVAARMRRHFQLLDEAAAAHPVLFAETGVLTPYTLFLARWSVLYPEDNQPWFNLSDFRTLAKLAEKAEARPALARVAQAEGLGANPFTAPQLPCPPEGTAN